MDLFYVLQVAIASALQKNDFADYGEVKLKIKSNQIMSCDGENVQGLTSYKMNMHMSLGLINAIYA